jgi:hypothetical protein
MPHLRLVLVVLSCSTLLAGSARGEDWNSRVMELVSDYPDKGFGGYRWPAKRGTHGTTRDLFHDEKRIARVGAGNHCVGITFELMWRAVSATPSAVESLTQSQARRLRRLWFVPEAGGMGPAEALPALGLGKRISDWEEARAGDFIQVWNKERTFGHSAVFLAWIRNKEQSIVGVEYWSSQPWTEGIGASDFAIGQGGDIDPDAVFIARLLPDD